MWLHSAQTKVDFKPIWFGAFILVRIKIRGWVEVGRAGGRGGGNNSTERQIGCYLGDGNLSVSPILPLEIICVNNLRGCNSQSLLESGGGGGATISLLLPHFAQDAARSTGD